MTMVKCIQLKNNNQIFQLLCSKKCWLCNKFQIYTAFIVKEYLPQDLVMRLNIYITIVCWSRVSHRCCEHGGGGGSCSKFDGGLKSKHGVSLKCCWKIPVKGVHLIAKLLAMSLQASKFTKNELLQTYLSRILARF